MPDLAEAVVILADAILMHAKALQSTAPSPQAALVGQSPPPPPPGGSQGPPGGSGGNDERRIKMGKKVFAICAQNGWDIADAGTRALGRPIGGDSRKWSEQELGEVLDAFKGWGYP